MMATLVTIDAHNGLLRRYEVGGEAVRKTHEYAHRGQDGEFAPATFTQAAVERMRLDPPDEFRLDPPPRPTMPPASAGRGSLANDEEDNGFLEARAA